MFVYQRVFGDLFSSFEDYVIMAVYQFDHEELAALWCFIILTTIQDGAPFELAFSCLKKVAEFYGVL